VRAVEDLLERRGSTLFLGFLKCATWAAVVTVLVVWTRVPGAHLAFAFPLSWPVAFGGLLFGVGAAINGGCAFSTVTHLGAGNLSAGLAIVGLGLGFGQHDLWIGPLLPAPTPGPSPLTHVGSWSVVLMATGWAWALHEALRLRRPLSGARVDRAMAAIGLAGGLLYALHGSWTYTAGLAQSAAWAMQVGPVPSALIPLLFLAVLAGAVCAACARNRFRLRWPTRHGAARSLAGGVLMGTGAALVPGGNDALVLHALPSLAPHAPLAYAALTVGAGATLLAIRALPRVRGRA
jgi:hypothetical protein